MFWRFDKEARWENLSKKSGANVVDTTAFTWRYLDHLKNISGFQSMCENQQ